MLKNFGSVSRDKFPKWFPSEGPFRFDAGQLTCSIHVFQTNTGRL